MSEKISNSSILDIFDSFLSDVNSALAYKSSLEEENRILKYDTDSCIADIQRKDETILGKEEEIARLLEKHLTTTKSHSSKISETKNDIRASTQLVEIRYEVCRLLGFIDMLKLIVVSAMKLRNHTLTTKSRYYRWKFSSLIREPLGGNSALRYEKECHNNLFHMSSDEGLYLRLMTLAYRK